MGGGAGQGFDFGATWGSGRLPLAGIGIETLPQAEPRRRHSGKETCDDEALIDESLVSELTRNKVKFKREDMVFITRDRTGQTIWLERGSASAGLAHLEKRGHTKELAKRFGVAKNDVPRLIRDIVRNGAVISDRIVRRHGRDGYERKYEYRGTNVVLAAVGMNGFLVSIYPI